MVLPESQFLETKGMPSAAVIDMWNYACILVTTDRKKGRHLDPVRFSYRVSSLLLGFTGACVLI